MKEYFYATTNAGTGLFYGEKQEEVSANEASGKDFKLKEIMWESDLNPNCKEAKIMLEALNV